MDEPDSATGAFPSSGWWGDRRSETDARDDATDGGEPGEGGTVTLASGGAVTVGPDGKVAYARPGSVKPDRDDGDDRDVGAGHRDPDENSAPVARDDFVFVGSRPHPYPKPIPMPYEAGAKGGAETVPPPPDYDDPIYTTLAIGEEGDPDPLPKSVKIAPLANDTDADGDPLRIATIDGHDVKAGSKVVLRSGATVKVSEDGTTLTYSTGSLRHEKRLSTAAPDDADTEMAILPAPRPKPVPYPADTFTYQAWDGEDFSNTATITVAQLPMYYD